MSVSVTKVEAAGNTFLLVDEAAVPENGKTGWVRGACSERHGLAADGVVFLLPLLHGRAGARVFNRDGGEAEVSLNGLRSVAAHHFWEGGEAPVSVGTAVGGWRVNEIADGPPESAVALSRRWRGAPLPLEDVPEAEGWKVEGVGNPHFVVPVAAPPGDEEWDERGEELSRHPAFPNGTNVQFVAERADGVAEMRTWERGVGPTLSCGSGAVAAAWYLACRHGQGAWRLASPGGVLEVAFTGDRVVAWGPVRRLATARLG